MIQRNFVIVSTLLVVFAVSTQPPHATANDPSSFREFLKKRGQDTTANVILDSVLAGPKVRWIRAGLPPRLKSRIHLNSAEVPRFPHDDPRLMNPRNWPPTMKIEGVLCSLTVRTMWADHTTYGRMLSDTSAAPVRLEMYYTDANANFHSTYVRYYGPFYDWLGGRLAYRFWVKGRGDHAHIQIYWPYPSGELFMFEDGEKKYNKQGEEIWYEWTEEVFARNGTLIGCGAAVNGDTNPQTGYWLGVADENYTYRRFEALYRSLDSTATAAY